MSRPITDSVILAREYAVEGADWTNDANGDARLRSRDVGYHGPLWEIVHSAKGELVYVAGHSGTPPHAAIATAHCARLGIPTPRRAAERLDALAKREETVNSYRHHAFAEAARLLRGEEEEES